MEKKKNNKKWIKFRHRVIRNLAFAVLYPVSKIKYHISVEKFKEQNGRQYLIIFNHQTAFDQFFVGMTFKGPVYYVASEDLFSNGFISRLLKYAVAPIPIKKQTTDIRAVMNCIKVAREGGTIALAPEGNRTYSGKTEYMNPAIASLAKKLKLPVAVCRIEGGYGVQPRWSDKVRKGKMRVFISNVIEPEELSSLSDTELYERIKQELYVDEGIADGEFSGKGLAEYLERAIYVCPDCGLAELESNGDIIRCKGCGNEVRYLPTKRLEGVSKKFPFEFVTEWYKYQQDYINSLDITEFDSAPAYEDTASLTLVHLYDRKEKLTKDSKISLFGNRIEISGGGDYDIVFKFDEISAVTVLGKNKLNIYADDKLYQLKGDKRFNALKYVNFFYRYKNIMSEEKNEQFLGL